MNFLRAVLFEDEEDEDKEELDEKAGEVSEERVPLRNERNNPGTYDESDNKEDDNQDEKVSEVKQDMKETKEKKETEEVDSRDEETLLDVLGTWNFGALVKNIKAKGEEIFNEYKEELQEFGDGLRRETGELVEITGHKVKDLPQSLESGAHVAQESLEEVGQTIEEIGSSLWKGTRDMIAHVKEAVALVEEEASLNARAKPSAQAYVASLQRGKYSRYETLVSAMQRDSSTYCDEPEDTEEFSVWKKSFKLDEKKQDVDLILKENAFMQELQLRIVPVIVEYDVFWTRYFYRLHKLQQAEDARADLVKRAANTEEEELSWDVDDEGEGSTPIKAKEEAKEKAEAEKNLPTPKNLPEAEKETRIESAEPETMVDEVSAASDADKMEGKKVLLPKEEENGSDSNSSGGDWQVVSKGSSPKEEGSDNAREKVGKGPPEKMGETAAAVLGSREEAGAVAGAVGQSSSEEKKVSEKKDKEAGKEGGEDEDWSEWE